MKRIIPYIALTGALLSIAFGQAQQESTDSKSEQEVEQMIEKYRAAFLRRDIPTLEKIWADDYVFVNAFGEVLSKAQRETALTIPRARVEHPVTVAQPLPSTAPIRPNSRESPTHRRC
jgi:hypothetical protein